MFQHRRVLVVGGTKGIGRAITLALWRYGAQVTYTGRTPPALNDLPTPNPPVYVPSDLSTVRGSLLFSERRINFAKGFDTVVFCQGVTATPTLQVNAEGIEQDFCTSYLSRFALLNSFLDRKQSTLRHVYVFGFPGVEYQAMRNMEDLNFVNTKYSQYDAHYNTIVCNECLVYEAARRYPGVRVFGMNPGLVPTGIRANSYGGSDTTLGRASELLVWALNPSADKYVERTVLPLMSSPEQHQSPMSYSSKGKPLPPIGWLAHEENRRWVWDVSSHMVKRAAQSPEASEP